MLMRERVVVRAPATVANLGPGFDCLGMALAWYDEISVERHDGGLDITASGLGADGVKRDETNYVYMGLRAVLGEDLPGVRIHKMSTVAFGRGFGSSAISIVAGLVAGRALGMTEHSDAALLAIATQMEGHPDNVAPCLKGGVTVIGGGKVLRLDEPISLRALVCVAPSRLSTKTARGILPENYSREDAVANLGRAALLAATLADERNDPELLLAATEDTFHQPQRFELMPDTADLVRGLRSRGIAAFLSGAGPSVAALVPAEAIEDAQHDAQALTPEGWEVRVEEFDDGGARVIEAR
jgi:homoserine kinase